ncbi:MAG: hypothetical protein KME05_14940 [Gloeocapsa sp. UFS-A4-WI-NPMV-4B04]|nr:hypothetical protein [Gloeocapsa sp. UFS-A4-WI-NPMV-4B04]
MSIAKLSLTSRQLTDLIITSRFEYWAEPDGKGLVESVKNVAAPAAYRQVMAEAVNNLQFLGFKVRLIKPSRTTHPDKAMAKVYP